MYKISFYVPESHLESVKSALFAAGAGRYRNYDQCCWQYLGQGQFRALTGSKPFLGNMDELETVAEFKVEVVCEDAIVKAAVTALLAAHPYEEPAYDVCRIMTIDEL